MDANQILGSSKETENYSRLDRLLVCGGTYLLRQLFDSYVPPTTLSSFLTSRRRLLHSAKFINKGEREKLYPSSGDPARSTNFDITLLVKLFRNLLRIPAPTNGWDHLPTQPEHQTIGDDLARIKYYRNEVHGHTTSMAIRDDIFQNIWDGVKGALLRIVKIVDPDREENWKGSIEYLLKAPVSKKVDFERLLKMEVGELRNYLSQQFTALNTSIERHSREAKFAVEQLRETVFHTLPSHSRSNPASTLVINQYNVNINNAAPMDNLRTSYLEQRTQQSSLPSIQDVPNLSYPCSSPQAAESQRMYMSKVNHTGLEQRHFLEGAHSTSGANDTRYQRLQRPYSEPGAIGMYIENPTSDLRRHSMQERVRQPPFSDSHDYGRHVRMRDKCSAETSQLRPLTTNWSAHQTRDEFDFTPKKNLYAMGAYACTDGSPVRSSDDDDDDDDDDDYVVEQTYEAPSVFEEGLDHSAENRGLIEISIKCEWIGNKEDIPSFKEDVNVAIFRSFHGTNLFQQYLEQKGLIIEDVQMRDKVCVLVLRPQNWNWSNEPWRNLDGIANEYLVSKDLLQCYGVSQILLTARISPFQASCEDAGFHYRRDSSSRSQSQSSESGNPCFQGMSRAKSMGNLTSLFGSTGDETTRKSAARELFQIICRRGGSIPLETAMRSLSQRHRQVIKKGHGEPAAFVKKFPDLFWLPRSQDIVIVDSVIDVHFCRAKGCAVSSCPDLHVCPFYLTGQCYYKTKCRRDHDVSDEHTERVLNGLDLGGLSIDEKTNLLRKIANERKSEWHTPGDQIAQVCSFYNKETGCTKPSCNRLHVCRYWIVGNCKFERCKRNHTYFSEREQRILKFYDMAGSPDDMINEILSPTLQFH